MEMKNKIFIVIPAVNEEKVIQEVIREIQNAGYDYHDNNHA